MFGKFFDTSAIDALASRITADLLKDLPPRACQEDSKSARKGREQAHARIRRHVEAFSEQVRPNFYQKAKLGVRLQEQLMAAGYPADFAKHLAYDVASQTAMGSPRS